MSLTSLERVRKALRHEAPDTVPVGPFAGFCAARIAGVTLYDYITNGKVLAEAQYTLWQKTGQDIVVTAADTYYIAEAFGLAVTYYTNALPTAKHPVLHDLREAHKLKIPNPQKDGRMPVYLEAVRELSKKFGDQVAIRGTGTGPFSLAAYLYGIEEFLIKLAEIYMGTASKAEVEGYRTLLDITSDTSIAFLNAQIDAGEHLVYLGDSLSSLNMISPSMYRQYVLPWHKKVFEGVREQCKQADAFTLLHACGDNTQLLEDYINTGVDMYEVDSMMDLKTCKDIVGSRLNLIGNLNPTEIVLNGSVDDVARESRTCLEVTAASEGGFILGTGCFVPLMSPLENIQQMVKTARNYTASPGRG